MHPGLCPHFAGFLHTLLLTTKQMIPQHQTSNNKNQSREGFRNKQEKRHSDPKTKQHQSKDPLHKNLRPYPSAVSICIRLLFHA